MIYDNNLIINDKRTYSNIKKNLECDTEDTKYDEHIEWDHIISMYNHSNETVKEAVNNTVNLLLGSSLEDLCSDNKVIRILDDEN